MCPRRSLSLALAVLALATVCAQQSLVEVGPGSSESSPEVEKRYTPELVSELQAAKDDALLLYTEYSAQNGGELKNFLRFLASLSNQTLSSLVQGGSENAEDPCREQLRLRVRKLEREVHRSATFNAENHHKFLLGHMIVFRMHLNKSEDLISKSQREIQICGISCENTPRVRRWRRQALSELHRVREDMSHSRRSYRDLLLHSRRRLHQLTKQATTKTEDALHQYSLCLQRG